MHSSARWAWRCARGLAGSQGLDLVEDRVHERVIVLVQLRAPPARRQRPSRALQSAAPRDVLRRAARPRGARRGRSGAGRGRASTGGAGEARFLSSRCGRAEGADGRAEGSSCVGSDSSRARRHRARPDELSGLLSRLLLPCE